MKLTAHVKRPKDRLSSGEGDALFVSLGRSQMDPTVGRKDDLLWVVDATYRRFLRRPTVGLFLPLPVGPSEWGSVALSLG